MTAHLILPVFTMVFNRWWEAVEILNHLEQTRDGITYNERVNLRLRRMNLKKDYRKRYKIGDDRYDLLLPDFKPEFAPPAGQLMKGTDDRFKVRADITFEMSEAHMDVIADAFVNMAGDAPVRMFNHHEAAKIAAGTGMLIAAEETRRWKKPYGMEMMRKVTEAQRFARSVVMERAL